MKDELYISYIPVLTKIVDMSEGPILELGMGFSTMLLNMMCRSSKREILSYENDYKWYEKNLKFKSDFHKIIFTDNWDQLKINTNHWSVAFIDHKPATRRKIEAVKLKDNADYIVLHDSEPELDNIYKYTEVYPLFKYRYDYTKCKPFTTVLSNVKKYTSD